MITVIREAIIVLSYAVNYRHKSV